MKTFFKKYQGAILLTLAITLAVVTRLNKLGEFPAGFYVDEAGQGYSAYSILETGKDEFGKPFPAIFRSLTDFKTPVYIYMIVPLIPVFGLTPFTVRFPSFLFSIFTIPVLYFLIKRLLPAGNNDNAGKTLAGISAILLAVSPWHILFGRTNFECNVALFFLLSGILAFYNGLLKPKFLVLSAILFAIAIPAYHSQRIITPLVVAALFFRYRKDLLDSKHLKWSIGGTLVAFLLMLPTLLVSVTPGFFARATGLNIFSHTRQMPDGFISEYGGILNPIVNGSWFLSAREFFSLYFSYLSPRYMFILGDYGQRSSFPELSTFFLWQFPFYIYGLFLIFKEKRLGELRFIMLLLLIVSPIPAAVTRDPYTTIRALPLVIPQTFIIALGIRRLLERVKTPIPVIIFSALGLSVILYSLLKLWSSVFVLNEFYRAKYWDWGWKEVTITLKEQPELPVVIDNVRSDPELIIAFFLKYNPEKYQQENFEVTVDEYYTNLTRVREKKVGKITTRGINWERDLVTDQILVGDELAISREQISNHRLTLIKEIFYPDGTVAFRIVRTNPEYEVTTRK
jgi:4-amino-4-deoxy-L-arabinose transferase-like glycosyltransferase